MANAVDSKSTVLTVLRVRVPPPVRLEIIHEMISLSEHEMWGASDGQVAQPLMVPLAVVARRVLRKPRVEMLLAKRHSSLQREAT